MQNVASENDADQTKAIKDGLATIKGRLTFN